MSPIAPSPFFPGFRQGPATPAGVRAAESRNPGLHTLQPADVLITLAHPDDESFLSGTAALLQQRGYRVQFVYVTDGNAGKDVSGKGLKGEALGKQRRKETREALKALEISRKPLFLSYPDGMIWQNASPIRQNLDEIIARTQPKLILSFGPDGITSHPDHVTIGALTDEAALAAGKSSEVYHMGLSPKSLTAFNKAFANCPDDSWIRTQASHDPTLVKVNVNDVLDKKQKAFASHRSQYPQYDLEAYKAFYAASTFEEFQRPVA